MLEPPNCDSPFSAVPKSIAIVTSAAPEFGENVMFGAAAVAVVSTAPSVPNVIG